MKSFPVAPLTGSDPLLPLAESINDYLNAKVSQAKRHIAAVDVSMSSDVYTGFKSLVYERNLSIDQVGDVLLRHQTDIMASLQAKKGWFANLW